MDFFSFSLARGNRKKANDGELTKYLRKLAERIFDSPLHEAEQGLLNPTNIDIGIIAGAIGTLIEDADDRNGVRVSDTARQVELAGNGHNGLRPHLDHDSPGQGPPCGNGDFDLIPLGEIEEILDLAFATPLAVLDVARDLDIAIEVLDALGQQEKQPAGLRPVGI